MAPPSVKLKARLHHLRQQKDTLLTVQPQPKPAASGASRPSSSDTPSSSFDNTLQRPTLADVDVPPVPSSSLNASTHNATNTPPSSAVAELMGQVGFLTDLSNFSLHEEDPTVDQDLLSDSQHQSEGSPLRFNLTFPDESVSVNRPVTALRFHTKFENVLLSAHAPRRDGKLGDPDGTIALWSLDDGRAALQRTLISNVPLTALELFPISPTLVVAGTSIGSILMWDTRIKSALPLSVLDQSAAAVANDLREYHGRTRVSTVRTSPCSSPVFVSTSVSGHICKWTLSHLDRPLAQTVLYDNAKVEELAFSSLDFPRSAHLASEGTKQGVNRTPSLFTGTLDGNVVRLDADGPLWAAHSSQGRHDAAVTSVHAHPAGNRMASLDDIVASASRDWTVRVWQFRRGQPCVPLKTLDLVADGAVFDVAWSSQHPTVLCSGDEGGVLSLFDLSRRLAPPSDKPAWQFVPKGQTSREPIRKVVWSADGRHVCTGDENGSVSLWNTTASLAGLPDAEWMGQFLKSKASAKE